jgi:hypothetical protein
MDIRVRAAGKTAGWLAIVTAIPALLVWLNVSSEAIGWIFFSAFFGFMIWTIYSIFLAQLKFESKLEETVSKLDK